MTLLMLCGSTWILLTTALIGGLRLLPSPWGPPEIAIVLLLLASVVAFARIGITSLVCVLLRLLPAGRMRTRLARCLLRRAPFVLRSSATTVLAASLIAAPAQAAGLHPAGPDPTWPTTSDAPTDHLPDPAWPHSPTPDGPAGSGAHNGSTDAPDGEEAPPPPEPSDASEPDALTTHTVVAGESLWSIAAHRISADDGPRTAAISRLVDDIHHRNRDRIGPDPNLIVPGQRLEIPS